MATFKELLQASFKSEDTEEWLDVHFTRPIGLVFALIWDKLGIHPNVITIVSIFLGAGAGWMFYHTELIYNVYGIILLMLANFCDSTDGQMARLTGKKTLLGRVLDGFSGDVWFFCVYVGIACRLMGQTIPGTDITWSVWIWALAIIAGVVCHSPQSSLSDYYRQIHLFFLKGKEGSELDNYVQQRAKFESLGMKDWFEKIYYYFYANYCKSQEKRTPAFQAFFSLWNQALLKHDKAQMATVRQEFLAGSRPLMPFTNILTFNTRAIVVYITCVAGSLTHDVIGPWIYLFFEIIILNILYIRMHKRHESLCRQMAKELASLDNR